MGQTFHWVTPVDCTPASGAWTDVDLDAYIGGLGADVTGVLVYVYSASTANIGIRKNGSTDDARIDIYNTYHLCGATGVDASHIFEAYVSANQYIYIIGYTTTGVTFFTNMIDYTPGSSDAWVDVDCSGDAPGAVGLIFGNVNFAGADAQFGWRKNGSTDDRHNCGICYGAWSIIGCDASQIAEAYIDVLGSQFCALSGYITDGATFHTNAVDRSLGGTGAYTDITCTAGAAGVVIEVNASDGNDHTYFLRKNGSVLDMQHSNVYHPWFLVECDANNKIEGIINSTNLDFFEIGYTEGAGGGGGGSGGNAAMFASLVAGKFI
jgi:hypothetical protein